MGIRYIGSIASSVSRNKKRKHNKQPSRITHPTHDVTKEQYLKWIEEGKCGCCGADSGECEGICDECRLS